MNQEGSDSEILVVGICGSLRSGSYTRMAVEIALRGAQDVGAETQMIDLRDYRLTFCDGRKEDDTYPEDVYKLREQVREAQGLILGSPEYHGGYSGVLKNALDLMGFAEIEGKMIGLVGVAGGALGAVNALNSLRAIGRALHAWVIPEQASIPEAWKHFDADGNVKDSNLEAKPN